MRSTLPIALDSMIFVQAKKILFKIGGVGSG